MCCNCGFKTEEFKYPKEKEGKNITITVRTLLDCTNCYNFFHRDKNACLNIYDVAVSHIKTKERPKHLRINYEVT